MVYVDYRVFIFFASAQVASIAVVCVTVTVVTSH
jgi:hypothetical protein